MSRLIDADALRGDIMNLPTYWADDGGYYGGAQPPMEGLLEPMDVLGTINAQPTIEERKTGEWIHAEWENINTGEIRKGRRCSACGCGYFRYDVSVNTVSDIPNFCPNCGADMRGGNHEAP